MYDQHDELEANYGDSWDEGAPWKARLNSNLDFWTVSGQVGEWLQVDLGQTKDVTGVITQGRPNIADNWVTSYKLQYSTDGASFTTYAGSDGSEMVFTGNTDGNTPVTNLLSNPISARYERPRLKHQLRQ
ncbi:lactadherin-like [Branchiostoma lanceolatum]|uniref:lactadherin-like n=1 Tax=Branchiostoma lanceolatum TaxID=7740 RepID=UPI003455CC9F